MCRKKSLLLIISLCFLFTLCSCSPNPNKYVESLAETVFIRPVAISTSRPRPMRTHSPSLTLTSSKLASPYKTIKPTSTTTPTPTPLGVGRITIISDRFAGIWLWFKQVPKTKRTTSEVNVGLT